MSHSGDDSSGHGRGGNGGDNGRGRPAGRARAMPPSISARDYPPVPPGDLTGGDPGQETTSSSTRASPKRSRDERGSRDGDRDRDRGSGSDNGSVHGSDAGSARGSERGGRGRGGGGARGAGGRAGRGGRKTYEDRMKERDDNHDYVATRVVRGGIAMSKRGKSGREVNLLANYYALDKKPNWCMFNYRVDFTPDEKMTRIKKQLVKPHAATLGAFIFDGNQLYTANRISPDPLVLCSVRDSDKEKIEITIRLVSELAPTDLMYLVFFNITVRKCLEGMDLEEIGRNYFDRHQAIQISAHKLELWPGYKTTMRNHENQVLLSVEITHKVLRTDNCLHVMSRMRGMPDYRKAVKDELIGSIVMTHYNRKTYRVDDIEWDKTPASTFEYGEQTVTFAHYFSQRYKLDVTDMQQPLLVSRPKKKDFHRGSTGPILLIPEFCQMTGLTDEMRSNFQLMKALTGYLHVGPEQRVEAVRAFMTRLKSARGVKEELERWGLRFNDRLIELKGRVVERERIMFKNNQSELVSDYADWNNAFRNQQMTSSVPLVNWAIIVPTRDAQAVETVLTNMTQVARPLRFDISRPKDTIRIPDIRIASYLTAIQQVMANYKQTLQMIFIILPKQVTDIYAAVKKSCSVEYGIPSQCFVAKNAYNQRGLKSICTKLVVQMNAKLGGEPWFVQIPLKKLMLVGFDVYHCGKRKGASVGAMVATFSENQARYFSTVSFHNSKEELSTNLTLDFSKCLHAYTKRNNGELPDRIIMYRDGVGEGQLQFVYDTEVGQIKNALSEAYTGAGKPLPKFTFIVVTKKINTRIFATGGGDRGRISNPLAGTVVDDVITLPERYDFYLISQHARQGTVSPTSYNVLFDNQGLDPDKMQRLTFKLCHMYFNWSGTVTVPAPCQYAHKLAYLTGIALQGQSAKENLADLLHYL